MDDLLSPIHKELHYDNIEPNLNKDYHIYILLKKSKLKLFVFFQQQ